MDFRDSPEEAAFRDRLRSWLTDQKGKFPTSGDEYWAAQGDWHQALYGAGFFGTSWPKEYGGQDLPPVYDVIVDEEIDTAAVVERVARKKLAQLGDLEPLVLRRRLFGFLARRGYDVDEIKRVVAALT